MMTAELQNLLKTNSNCEGCSDQASLRDLLTDLRAVADELDLSFAAASRDAAAASGLGDWPTCPCI
jgi:hypothetical protein